jgi:hypothetical protein
VSQAALAEYNDVNWITRHRLKNRSPLTVFHPLQFSCSIKPFETRIHRGSLVLSFVSIACSVKGMHGEEHYNSLEILFWSVEGQPGIDGKLAIRIVVISSSARGVSNVEALFTVCVE